MQKMTITVEAYDTREKIVKRGGTSSMVYLPKDWEGKRVKVLLIEPIE